MELDSTKKKKIKIYIFLPKNRTPKNQNSKGGLGEDWTQQETEGATSDTAERKIPQVKQRGEGRKTEQRTAGLCGRIRGVTYV